MQIRSYAPTLTDCSFHTNIAHGVGGGVRSVDGGNPAVARCQFISNKANYGGAMDFRLRAGSPCIDSGLNDAAIGLVVDLDGAFRIVDGNSDGEPVVDMGAFEFSGPACAPADLDCDGAVNGADLGLLLAAWVAHRACRAGLSSAP